MANSNFSGPRCKTADDEIYEPDPDRIDICFCGVCGEEMDVERNVPPSGGFAGAMAGHNRYYDKFWCKSRKEKWHRQARALKHEIRTTPSKKLADLMQEELTGILQTKIATKWN